MNMDDWAWCAISVVPSIRRRQPHYSPGGERILFWGHSRGGRQPNRRILGRRIAEARIKHDQPRQANVAPNAAYSNRESSDYRTSLGFRSNLANYPKGPTNVHRGWGVCAARSNRVSLYQSQSEFRHACFILPRGTLTSPSESLRTRAPNLGPDKPQKLALTLSRDTFLPIRALAIAAKMIQRSRLDQTASRRVLLPRNVFLLLPTRDKELDADSGLRNCDGAARRLRANRNCSADR